MYEMADAFTPVPDVASSAGVTVAGLVVFLSSCSQYGAYTLSPGVRLLKFAVNVRPAPPGAVA